MASDLPLPDMPDAEYFFRAGRGRAREGLPC